MPWTVILILLGSLLLTAGGCIRRSLSITSTPPGALVWVNHREVGRTPVSVDFTHYGTYDVRIERDGMEPLMTSRKASAPAWDLPGPDLVVEVLPFQANSRVHWHFDLEPRDESHDALVDRARSFRAESRGIELGTIQEPGLEEVHLDGTQAPTIDSAAPGEGSSEESRTKSTPSQQ